MPPFVAAIGMPAFAALPTIAVGVALLGITIAVLRTTSLAPTPEPTGSPIDVIIPARDEAASLPHLLEDLRRQTLQARDVFVVDDHSTDGTATIAAAAGATVLAAPPTPAGWNPKVWAMQQGVDASPDRPDGVRLMFLDADVRLAPGALAAVTAAADRDGGLLSVAPWHCRVASDGAATPIGAVESLSAPFNITIDAGGGPGLTRHARGAIGSCLTMSRADYDACGGHRATPNTIVDDLALAATARAHGLNVTMLQSRPTSGSDSARPLVTVRSYPDGFGALARGWTKNLSAGLGTTPPMSALAVAAWVAALCMPLAVAVQADWSTAAVLWGTVAAHTWWLSRLVGWFSTPVVSLGAPILGVWFAAVAALSVVVRLTGRRVRWKGRALRPDGVETQPR